MSATGRARGQLRLKVSVAGWGARLVITVACDSGLINLMQALDMI